MELKKLMDPAICGIVEQLQKAGYEAYIVGGAVRDLLLDRSPKDYDLSTSATPEEIRKVFRDRRTLIIGKRFQLVHLLTLMDLFELLLCKSHYLHMIIIEFSLQILVNHLSMLQVYWHYMNQQ